MEVFWSYLGEIPYRRALALQQALRDGLLGGGGEEALLLLQHPPVVTLGRSARAENVLLSEEALAARGVERVQVERGGDVTFHGPGQLVGYPLRRVGRAVRPHVEGMGRALVRLLAGWGIEAHWSDARPGVWTEAGKIAAVGVDARGGVATHGFALNLTVAPAYFQLIVPCGYRAPVVSAADLGAAAARDLPGVAEALVPLLCEEWGVELPRRRPAEQVLEVLR